MGDLLSFIDNRLIFDITQVKLFVTFHEYTIWQPFIIIGDKSTLQSW